MGHNIVGVMTRRNTCEDQALDCFFIGTLSQTLTLRAAFTSSTYLQEQIPEPGRSSDDDLLNSAGAPAVTATSLLYLSDE